MSFKLESYDPSTRVRITVEMPDDVDIHTLFELVETFALAVGYQPGSIAKVLDGSDD